MGGKIRLLHLKYGAYSQAPVVWMLDTIIHWILASLSFLKQWHLHLPTFFHAISIIKNHQLRILGKFEVSCHQVVIQSDACIWYLAEHAYKLFIIVFPNCSSFSFNPVILNNATCLNHHLGGRKGLLHGSVQLWNFKNFIFFVREEFRNSWLWEGPKKTPIHQTFTTIRIFLYL